MRRRRQRGGLPAVTSARAARATNGMISPDGAVLPQPRSDLLHYPNLAVPQPGQLLKVQEGLWWLRMPLPISLDHINLWLLEETGGYSLVDTGMATAAARALWEQLAN